MVLGLPSYIVLSVLVRVALGLTLIVIVVVNVVPFKSTAVTRYCPGSEMNAEILPLSGLISKEPIPQPVVVVPETVHGTPASLAILCPVKLAAIRLALRLDEGFKSSYFVP